MSRTLRRTGLAGGIAVLLGLGILCLAQLHCDLSGPKYDYFVVRVNSLAVPDSLPHTDTLRIRLFGTIGSSSLYTLDRIDSELRGHEIDLTVWGKFDREASYSWPMLNTLYESYDVYPMAPGEFRIRVRQPDSTVLSDSTVVF